MARGACHEVAFHHGCGRYCCDRARWLPEQAAGAPAAHSVPASSDERDDDSRRDTSTGGHRASEISWFQGTLEEAFSRTRCSERRALFRY